MKSYANTKASRKVLKEITAYFADGGRLTINGILSEYFDPRNPHAALVAKQKVTGWVCRISSKFNKQGKMFGRLNAQGEYGFAKTEEEARYIGTRAYILTKGHIVSSGRKLQNGQRQKLLKTRNESVAYFAPVS